MTKYHDTSYRYILAFGSNKGNRKKHCFRALESLTQYASILRQSAWLITKPLRSKDYDTCDHEDYLNFIVEIKTNLRPVALYKQIQKTEDLIGHSRKRRWLPRELDIDILFFSKDDHIDFNDCTMLIFKESGLKIPHQSFFERDFLVNLVKSNFKIDLDRISNPS